jgi:hypothetical protein
MTAQQAVDRKLFLKEQTLILLKTCSTVSPADLEKTEQDIVKLRERRFLLAMKQRLESKIGEDFDPTLSLLLDAIEVLLDERIGGRADG